MTKTITHEGTRYAIQDGKDGPILVDVSELIEIGTLVTYQSKQYRFIAEFDDSEGTVAPVDQMAVIRATFAVQRSPYKVVLRSDLRPYESKAKVKAEPLLPAAPAARQ